MRTIGAARAMRHSPTSGSTRDGYRTVNDVGYLDEAGYLYLSGRRDDMVTVGGENVHTDAVVAVLMNHEAVADAAVLAVPDETLGHRLVAFVVPREHDDIRFTLFSHCLVHLSPYQVPGEIVVVDRLDRTTAGKVRKHVLEEIHTRELAIGHGR